MTNKSSALRRLTATVGTVAVAVAGVISMGQVASAQPMPEDPSPSGVAGNVGPDQQGAPTTGSLTVHKRLGSEGDAGTGEVLGNPSGTALPGAEFTVWQLGKSGSTGCDPLDLSKTAAWEFVPTVAAPGTIAGVEAAGFCLDENAGVVGITDGNGEYTFGNLDLGLYYVQETDAPSNIVSRTAPFYVSIPLPHAQENWLYDVHVYPKNQESNAPSKTINTDVEQPVNGVTVGSVVEWTISQTVPALKAGDVYESASIWDVLNPEELAYDATTSVTLNGAALTDVTDYIFDLNGVTWTLNAGVLATLKAGDVLEVKFTTTVLKVTETGDIANPGSEGPGKPGYGSEFNGGSTPGGPTPHTYWGQLSVNKVDEAEKPLEGAEFAVFDNAENGVCAPEAPQDDAIATGISGVDGVVLWDATDPASDPLGLWIANSDTPLTDLSKAYCLYETKAPAGYVAETKGNVVNIKPGTNAKLVVDIENTKKDGPDLPLTGGQGTMMMTLGGLALMLAGAGAVFALRRRNEA